MAVNFEPQLNQIRSILRGEVNGATRFVALSLAAAVVWVSVSWVSSMNSGTLSALALQQKRYRDLAQLAAEHKALVSGGSSLVVTKMDALTAFTQVSDQMSLGNRVSRVVPTPDGRDLSLEINRLYAEELVGMIRELAARGIRVTSSEIRALPVGEERLFSLVAVIGPEA